MIRDNDPGKERIMFNGFCNGHGGWDGYHGGCAHGPSFCGGPHMHHHCHPYGGFGCLGSIVRFIIGLAVLRFILRFLFF